MARPIDAVRSALPAPEQRVLEDMDETEAGVVIVRVRSCRAALKTRKLQESGSFLHVNPGLLAAYCT